MPSIASIVVYNQAAKLRVSSFFLHLFFSECADSEHFRTAGSLEKWSEVAGNELRSSQSQAFNVNHHTTTKALGSFWTKETYPSKWQLIEWKKLECFSNFVVPFADWSRGNSNLVDWQNDYCCRLVEWHIDREIKAGSFVHKYLEDIVEMSKTIIREW